MLVHHRIPSMKWPGVSLLPPGLDASPSQDTQHEVTRSITTPPLDGMLVHHRIPSMKCLGVLLLPLVGMLVHHRMPSMKWLGVLLLPLDGMLVHHRVTIGRYPFIYLGPVVQSSINVKFDSSLITNQWRLFKPLFVPQFLLSRKWKTQLIFNCGLALIGFRTNGPGWRETRWSKVLRLRKPHSNEVESPTLLSSDRLHANHYITAPPLGAIFMHFTGNSGKH